MTTVFSPSSKAHTSSGALIGGGGSEGEAPAMQLASRSLLYGAQDKALAKVNSMFVSHTLGEMRFWERDLHRQIDEKHSQMRNVVCMSYPDLVDAANSVIAMKSQADLISKRIASLEALISTIPHTQQMRQPPVVDGYDTLTDSDSQTWKHALAIRLKVLVDAPEQVWKLVERNMYLHAALVYLFAEHIYCELTGNTFVEASSGVQVHPMIEFPIIQRQWAVVASLRSHILDRANRSLSCPDRQPLSISSPRARLNALCAQLVLDHWTGFEQASSEFLEGRRDAIMSELRILSNKRYSSIESTTTHLIGALAMIMSTILDYSLLFLGAGSASDALPSQTLVTLATLLTGVDVAAMFPDQTSLGGALNKCTMLPETKRSQHKLSIKGPDTPMRERSAIPNGVLERDMSAEPDANDSIPLAMPMFAQVLAGLVPEPHARNNIALSAGSSLRSATTTNATMTFASLVAGPANLMGRYLPQDVLDFLPPPQSILPPEAMACRDDPKALFESLRHAQARLESRLLDHIRSWWSDTWSLIASHFDQPFTAILRRIKDASEVRDRVLAWESEQLGSNWWDTCRRIWGDNNSPTALLSFSPYVQSELERHLTRIVQDSLNSALFEAPRDMIAAWLEVDVSSNTLMHDPPGGLPSTSRDFRSAEGQWLRQGSSVKRVQNPADRYSGSSSTTGPGSQRSRLPDLAPVLGCTIDRHLFPLPPTVREIAESLERDVMRVWMDGISWASQQSSHTSDFVVGTAKCFEKCLNSLVEWLTIQVEDAVEHACGQSGLKLASGDTTTTDGGASDESVDTDICLALSFVCKALERSLRRLVAIDDPPDTLCPEWLTVRPNLGSPLSVLSDLGSRCDQAWAQYAAGVFACRYFSIFDALYLRPATNLKAEFERAVSELSLASSPEIRTRSYANLAKLATLRVIQEASREQQSIEVCCTPHSPSRALVRIVVELSSSAQSAFGLHSTPTLWSLFWRSVADYMTRGMRTRLEALAVQKDRSGGNGYYWEQLHTDVSYLRNQAAKAGRVTGDGAAMFAFSSLLGDIETRAERPLRMVEDDNGAMSFGTDPPPQDITSSALDSLEMISSDQELLVGGHSL
ncbi:hypothetical protein EV182_001753 [Spiromyces aspiralis]|uniref:Uncharacterized protein n=1 Tax=Spiromyces aspiralis TaxID=68401 RepID=A0ACC1HT06_9FUNG|nr:hypothetical protein EV182_001753 [Spiromyces aspiralis]